MDLSIIIVNYNVKEFLLNLLDSLQYAIRGLTTEIIVIDNNSIDGSVEAVRKKFPSIIIIANDKNVGFGKANNQGLERSQGKYLLLINPDTLVKEDTIIKTVEFLKRNVEIGLVGCKVLNPDGSLQLACRRSFPRPWVSFTKVAGLSSLFPKSRFFAKYNLAYLNENESYEVDAVSGSFMMLTREAYEKTDGFDTDFFMYGEDLDLCYRVQKNGLKVYYFSETEIIHYKGESTKRSSIDETKIFYDAMHHFVKKHFSSSFFIELILQFGIFLRKTLAFANLNKYIIVSTVIDFISFYLLLNFAEHVYASEKWPGFPSIYKPWVYIIPSIIQVFISGILGSYKRNSLSVLRSLISLFVGLIIITSLTFFFKQYAFSRAVVLITYGFALLIYSLWRTIVKFSFMRKGTIGESFTKTMIVGTDEKAILLGKKVNENLAGQYNLIGFVGLGINEIGLKIGDLKVLGSINNIKKVIKEYSVDNLIFSSESLGFEKIFSAISECQGYDVNFLISGNELDYMVGKSNISHIDNVSLLKVDYNISRPLHYTLKRIFDITTSSSAILIFYIPAIVITKIFRIKSKLLKSILFMPTVLIGKNSLVGPQKLNENNELYLGRPGLTGLWYLENTDINEENENRRLDLFYAKNQNIWLDLEIIGKSVAKYFNARSKNG